MYESVQKELIGSRLLLQPDWQALADLCVVTMGFCRVSARSTGAADARELFEVSAAFAWRDGFGGVSD
jgi:hypothetical protein